MPPTPDDPLQSPQDSDSEPPSAASTTRHPKHRPGRHAKSPLGSVSTLPYRRSNASLSALFQSTSSLPTLQPTRSPDESGTSTPTGAPVNGSVFSPTGSTRAGSPAPGLAGAQPSGEAKEVILRAFAPHISVLPSQDTEELLRHKGINGGLLELLRPFGEHISGKVTIRESSGASRSYEDFAVRFVGVRDGLESPRLADRRSTDSAGGTGRNGNDRLSSLEYRPARLRSGGDVPQVEELVERHLTFSEEQSWPVEADYLTHKDRDTTQDPSADSPFYLLYLRRLLSGMPMVPSETFTHPVAIVIAISSRSPSPIEELRTLYASSNTGDQRLPPWVLNEFLRYYVLVHDEDYDDISKSMALYDQMKRHFGLHCHLLRLRSTACLPSDDESTPLPHSSWQSSAEELAEIVRRETSEDDADTTPHIFDSDVNALRAFVREMVTQSIIPGMERASAQWNDQVASRRRGFSGRFMSLGKRLTAFGQRNSTGPVLGSGSGGGGAYDPQTGSYPPTSPEGLMRRLADYAVMLRDFKLAQSVYDILLQDYRADKAWRHHAAASEMAALSTLLASSSALPTKTRVESVDVRLEEAYYDYSTRCGAPYNALRTLLLGAELLKARSGGSSGALDSSARRLSRLLDDRLIGPVGHALLLERMALCYGAPRRRRGGERGKKAGFWMTLAAEAWLGLDKAAQAERCLKSAVGFYDLPLKFAGMQGHLFGLQCAVKEARSGPNLLELSTEGAEAAVVFGEGVEGLVEPLQDLGRGGPLSPGLKGPSGHRKSLSTTSGMGMPLTAAAVVGGAGAGDPLGALPATAEGDGFEGKDAETRSPGLERGRRNDGFE